MAQKIHGSTLVPTPTLKKAGDMAKYHRSEPEDAEQPLPPDQIAECVGEDARENPIEIVDREEHDEDSSYNHMDNESLVSGKGQENQVEPTRRRLGSNEVARAVHHTPLDDNEERHRNARGRYHAPRKRRR